MFTDRHGVNHPTAHDEATTERRNHILGCEFCRHQFPTITKWLEDQRKQQAPHQP